MQRGTLTRLPEGATTFSLIHPHVRLVWDAHTLGAYLKDPLSYYYRHVRGLEDDDALTLAWGRLYHAGVERLWAGAPLEEVLRTALREADECELDRLHAEAKDSHRRGRTLRDLGRAFVWYSADMRQAEFEVVEQEAVRIRQIPSPRGFGFSEREPMYYVTRIDAIARDTQEERPLFGIERKHTNQTITSGAYWQQWNPNLQVWGYDWMLGGVENLSGRVMIEALQTGARFCRVERQWVMRTPAQRAEFLPFLRHWIGKATQDAIRGEWLPNPTLRFAGDFGSQIARRAPESRDDWVGLEYGISGLRWDPVAGERTA